MGSPAKSQITVRSLGFGVERQAVIDAPDALVDAEQRVAGLAVGVVGQQVEEGRCGGTAPCNPLGA